MNGAPSRLREGHPPEEGLPCSFAGPKGGEADELAVKISTDAAAAEFLHGEVLSQ